MVTEQVEIAKEFCEWFPSKFLFISENVFSSLIYYSHLLPTLVCLVLVIFLIAKTREQIAGKALIFLCSLFAVWSIFDLITWANESPSLIMFFWTSLIILEPLIFIASLYFLLVFIKGKDITLKEKFILCILIAPTIIFIPTQYAIENFSLLNCEREVTEGWLVYYGYLMEIFIVIWTVLAGFRASLATKDPSRKKQIAILTTGIFLFLLAFSWGNISGSLTEDWSIGQYGLLGMPIFIGFLVYVMVTYKTFHAKLFGAQALVASLWLLVMGILFVRTVENVRIITSITLILLLVLGIQLVRGIRKEIEQKEKIEKLAIDLEKANARLRELDNLKSEFLSFASHQLRSPLTAMNGHVSMILEGDFGEIPEKIKTPIETVDKSTKSLIKIVNDFLNISRIEQGRMQYDYDDFNAKELVEEVITELRPNVEAKGLTLDFSSEEGKDYLVHADKGKLKQVIGNIIDNSIKYTPSGGVKVDVSRVANAIRISIKDTGIGIDPNDISKLFSKFSRAKDAHKTNVTGTGLGLYVAKQMIESQKGKIWVESQGKGSGSTFFIEFEAKN